MTSMVARWYSVVLAAVLGLAASGFTQVGASFGNQDSPATSTDMLILSGKVALEDGSPVPTTVILIADCGSEVYHLGPANAQGDFSVRVSNGSFDRSTSIPSESGNFGFELAICDLRADAPGFAGRKIPLAGLTGQSGVVRIGTLVLHPTTAAAGVMISAADAAVPDRARKELEKGQKEARKGKIAAAREMFEKLALHYPKFALAWIELGRLQAQQSEANAARYSFQEALSVDQKLVVPYVELSQLALRDRHWQELADTTDKLLEIAPTPYPEFWFFNAVGNYNVRKFDRAEKSLLRGLALDPQHRFPKMEYLMGLVLETKHDYSGAAERFGNYLQFVPNAEDSPMARRQLKDCQSAAQLIAGDSKRASGK